MLTMIFYLSIIIIINLLLINMNIFLSMNNKINREKNYPFECGFNMNSHSRLPFIINFYLITLLFLIFDVEIMMIIPTMYLMSSFNSMYMTLILLFFILILIISLMYEWIYSLLNWIFY
uniref:NADH-ubiquinone oxidoreductase chain 3 n=1 Tax=Megachile sculpturalis TaxID=1004196 RepID=A0A0M4L9T5_9HYME|nr:NADH dehydrogenase subunit 3 [Megachile sculpturalis]